MSTSWARPGALCIAAVLLLVSPALTPQGSVIEAAKAETFFKVIADRPDTKELFLEFVQSRVPVQDLEPRPEDGAFGTGKWTDGDRLAYNTAFWYFAHEDPGHHEIINGIRVMLQVYTSQSVSIRINDKFMAEPGNSSAPYPYEPGKTIPLVDRSRQGAVVNFYHTRTGGSSGGVKNRQLLMKWVIPAVSPVNSKVRAYYQLGGLIVFEHADLGIIARVIIASTHGVYFYEVEGI